MKALEVLNSLKGSYVEIIKGFQETGEVYSLEPKISGYVGTLTRINNYKPHEEVFALYSNNERLTGLIGDKLHIGATEILNSMILEIILCDSKGFPVETVYKY